MAVRINPCFGCPLRKGCEQKQEFSKRVAGLGLRSATFDCSRLSEALSFGSRIVVKMPTFGPDEYEGTVFNGHREVNATIHSSDGNRFACVVDKADIDLMVEDEVLAESADPAKIRHRKTMRHTRIVRFLDEPKWTKCESHGLVSPSGDCAERECYCANDPLTKKHAELNAS